MIEVKSIRFVKYDRNNHRIYVLLLTDENESLPADILVGLPETMTRELMEYIMSINTMVSKNYNHTEDDEIDLQKIDRFKVDWFFEQVIAMVIHGRNKGALEVKLSDEVRKE